MLVPSLCPRKQGQIEQVSQDHVLNISGSEYFQGWSLYSLSGQPVSGFEHPYNATEVTYINILQMKNLRLPITQFLCSEMTSLV